MKKTARLDRIFVKLGSATEEQITEAITRQTASCGRLGENLMEMGIITEQQLLAALSEQFRIPTVQPGAVPAAPGSSYPSSSRWKRNHRRSSKSPWMSLPSAVS